MTDNDIVLGLKCLADEDEILCKDCAFLDTDRGFACKKNVSKAAIDLINRQKAEIESLEAEIDKQYEQAEADILGNMSDGGTSCHWCIAQHRAEAIKEFAERLKKSSFPCDVSFDFGREHCEEAVTVLEIDNLVKEMTEETP